MRGLAILLALLLGLGAPPAAAERADQGKPVNVEADRMTADDAKQVAVFEGRVVVTQGTRMLRADKVTIRQDGEGFQYATAVGNPATFREKREGTDEWIEGEALRIEYNGRTEFVELFNDAILKRSDDEVRGNYISYDARAELFRVQSAKEPAGAPSRDARVRAVIQPKPKEPAAKQAPGAPLDLQPSRSLDKGR